MIPQKINTSPFCLRLSEKERAQLEQDAAGVSLGAYIRERVFDQNTCKRQRRGKFPVQDHIALSQVLAKLGSSNLSNNLNQIAKAMHTGNYSLEMDAVILVACADIREIRQLLMIALGLRA